MNQNINKCFRSKKTSNPLRVKNWEKLFNKISHRQWWTECSFRRRCCVNALSASEAPKNLMVWGATKKVNVSWLRFCALQGSQMWSMSYVVSHCPGGVSNFTWYLAFYWRHASISAPGHQRRRQWRLWYPEEWYADKPHHGSPWKPPPWLCQCSVIDAPFLEEVSLNASTWRCIDCGDVAASCHRLSSSSPCWDPFEALLSIHGKPKPISLTVPLSINGVRK